MGFETNAIKLLLYLKRQNVELKKVLTLGRQSYQVYEGDFISILAHSGINSEMSKTILQKDNTYIEPFLMELGASAVESMDASSYESATIIHDMNVPVPATLKSKYDTVIDAGTLEHIFNFPTAIKNCMEMIKTGGHFVGITITNNFSGHGFYQFSPELFFRIFSPENGFAIKKMFLAVNDAGNYWYEIPDPKQVKKRILFENSMQTYLLIVAEKTAEKEIFRDIPQQSDYEFLAWKGEQQFPGAKKKLTKKLFFFIPDRLKKDIRRRLRILDPNAWKIFLRNIGSGDSEDFKKMKNL